MAGDRQRLFVAWNIKKTYVSYLNNEISIHDFKYVVTTDIWWPLTARDCFCCKKWSAKPLKVIKQLFFGCSISPLTCFFFVIVRKICNIFPECLLYKLVHENIWLHRTSNHSTMKRISRKNLIVEADSGFSKTNWKVSPLRLFCLLMMINWYLYRLLLD